MSNKTTTAQIRQHDPKNDEKGKKKKETLTTFHRISHRDGQWLREEK
jgi:hypothetical protein